MFKSIPGFFGIYEISKLGLVQRVQGKQCKSVRQLKPQIDKRGYKRVKLCKDGVAKDHFVHKLVAITYIGEKCDEMTINHKDGNKLNNSVENLEYLTRAENIKHAVSLGLVSLSGAKLTGADALFVKKTYVYRKNAKELAEMFGVSTNTIRRIASGKFWKHIT